MNRTTAMILALALLGGLGCRLFSLPKVVVPVTATPTATLTPGSGAGMPVLTPAPSTPSGEEVRKVRIDRVVVLSQTVVITFTVTGQQEFLFDLPELNGKYPTPESLGDAHFTLLDRITRGRATAMLEFPRPADGPPWTLTFNPDHAPVDTAMVFLERLKEAIAGLRARVDLDEIDHLVATQISPSFLNMLRRLLNLREDQVCVTGHEYGHSGSDLMIGLDVLKRSNRLAGNTLLLAAADYLFAAGLVKSERTGP